MGVNHHAQHGLSRSGDHFLAGALNDGQRLLVAQIQVVLSVAGCGCLRPYPW